MVKLMVILSLSLFKYGRGTFPTDCHFIANITKKVIALGYSLNMHTAVMNNDIHSLCLMGKNRLQSLMYYSWWVQQQASLLP